MEQDSWGWGEAPVAIPVKIKVAALANHTTCRRQKDFLEFAVDPGRGPGKDELDRLRARVFRLPIRNPLDSRHQSIAVPHWHMTSLEHGTYRPVLYVATEVEEPAFGPLRRLGFQGQSGLGQESVDEGGPVLDPLEPVLDDRGELVHVADGEVAQAVLMFAQAPSAGLSSGRRQAAVPRSASPGET